MDGRDGGRVERRECGAHAEAKWHRKADCRPAEIMQAALEVFAEKGYGALRLDDVAARAGVTKPLIYHYFEGKEDLIRRTIAWRMGAFFDYLREERDATEGGWEDRLRRVLEVIWQKWEAKEWNRFHALLAEVRAENPSLYRSWIEHSVGERVRAVRAILDEAGDALVPDLDRDAAAAFLVCGSLQLVHLHAHVGAGPLPEFRPQALRGAILDIFLRGVRRSEGSSP